MLDSYGGGGGGASTLKLNILILKMLQINIISYSGKKIHNLFLITSKELGGGVLPNFQKLFSSLPSHLLLVDIFSTRFASKHIYLLLQCKTEPFCINIAIFLGDSPKIPLSKAAV